MRNVGVLVVLLLFIVVYTSWPAYAENSSPSNPFSSGADNKMPADTEENLLQHMDQILKNKNIPATGNLQEDLYGRVKQQAVSITTDRNAYINSVTFADGFKINIYYGFDAKGNVSTVLFGHGHTFISVSIIQKNEGSFFPESTNEPVTNMGNGNTSASPVPANDSEDKTDDGKSGRVALVAPLTPSVPPVTVAPVPDNAQFTLKIKQTPEEFSALVSSLKTKPASDGKFPSSESFDFSALKQVFKSFDKAQKIAFQTYIQESNLYYLEMKNKLDSNGAKVDLKKSENISYLETRKKIDRRVEEIIAGENRDSFRADVHTSQIRLFREYIEPSQNKLRQTLRDNFTELGKKIELLIPGKTTIHIDGDITEILIYLSVPS